MRCLEMTTPADCQKAASHGAGRAVLVQQAGAIILPDGECSLAKRIEDPDSVGLAGHRRDLGSGSPVKLGDLAVDGEMTTQVLAPEHEGNNAAHAIALNDVPPCGPPLEELLPRPSPHDWPR